MDYRHDVVRYPHELPRRQLARFPPGTHFQDGGRTKFVNAWGQTIPGPSRQWNGPREDWMYAAMTGLRRHLLALEDDHRRMRRQLGERGGRRHYDRRYDDFECVAPLHLQ